MIGVWLAALTFHLICKWLLMNNLQDKNMQLNTGANTTHVTNEWKNTLCKGMGGFTIGDERYLYIWLSLWGSFRYGILFMSSKFRRCQRARRQGVTRHCLPMNWYPFEYTPVFHSQWTYIIYQMYVIWWCHDTLPAIQQLITL